MTPLSEETRRRLMQAHLDHTTDEEPQSAGWTMLGCCFVAGFGLAFWLLVYWAFFS